VTGLWPRGAPQDGSTSVTALLIGATLYVGWAGDSRALLVGGGGALSWASVDHKPDRPDEKKRIEALGGCAPA
jgi:serine/threonine protein phosphatase PrpC